ncbi:MAG TPA: zinc-binding dehydrogenase [Candidatus Dormibacteraeota bacterium]|nr:zinc-binding dehydrogenase [Candidatus Dormibacteraeota bacterium]
MKRLKMQATIVTAPNQCRLEEVPVPEPREDEVRVRLEGCGICGSNVAPWEGRPWFRYPLAPGELGHEGWGQVDAIGGGVNSIREGDRVALLSYRAYAEYDIAPESAVVRLPGALDSKPFPGEALGCAMNVFRRCGIRPGETVAVVGIGFLGAVLVGLSTKAGARVMAISRRSFALEIAKTMGAAATISCDDSASQAALEVAREWTGGKGFDCVIEAAGSQAALDLATELTRERDRLIIAGYHQDGMRQVNMQLWNWRGLDVINAHEREPRIYREGVEEAVRAVSSGELDPSPLYTHEFRLNQLADGLNAMKRKPDRFLKGLVLHRRRMA